MLGRITESSSGIDYDISGSDLMLSSYAIQRSRLSTTVGSQQTQNLSRIRMHIHIFNSVHIFSSLEDSREEAWSIPEDYELM